MCGRFSLANVDSVWLKKHFNLSLESDWPPRYNLAPNQNALTIVSSEGKRILKPMVWGFIPHFAKEKKAGVINARAETVAEKPFFRKSFQSRRCLVLADGFYEWKKEGSRKIPYRFVVKGEPNFCFGAIYDIFTQPDGSSLFTFAILTTEANSLLSKLHDRMPLIFGEEGERNWLDAKEPKMGPFPAVKMEGYVVSEKVNNWRNDTPDCFLTNI